MCNSPCKYGRVEIRKMLFPAIHKNRLGPFLYYKFHPPPVKVCAPHFPHWSRGRLEARGACVVEGGPGAPPALLRPFDSG